MQGRRGLPDADGRDHHVDRRRAAAAAAVARDRNQSDRSADHGAGKRKRASARDGGRARARADSVNGGDRTDHGRVAVNLDGALADGGA